MICKECETVAHCTMHGCIPKQTALDKKAENAKELGLDYEPDYKVTVVDDQHPNGVPLEQWGRPAPDLQADLVKANAQAEYFEREWYLRGDELEATNRQVEILSDALAESRREVAALKAVQEPVAWQPLPCPFCGHIGLDFLDGETYRWGVASCGGCGASCGDVRREYPDQGEWHAEAIAEWNRRSPAAQRQWVGLKPGEAEAFYNQFAKYQQEGPVLSGWFQFTKAIEAKLKEKNT
jgi:hypothetical protein